MHQRHRKLLMASLVFAFVVQTTLVYTDGTALAQPPLDSLALAGRALWHRHACHTCHQLYGFGGFLGPDLTNAASRLTRARLDEMLTQGSGQMPAFQLAPAEIDALEAYLRGLHQTGIGQARSLSPAEPAAIAAAIDAHANAHPLSEQAQAGRALFAGICATCHRLLQPTPLGPFVAPDLTNARSRLGADEIERVLVAGRPAKGMPPLALSGEQRASVHAFLAWLDAERGALCARLGGEQRGAGLPWFEYQ